MWDADCENASRAWLVFSLSYRHTHAHSRKVLREREKWQDATRSTMGRESAEKCEDVQCLLVLLHYQMKASEWVRESNEEREDIEVLKLSVTTWTCMHVRAKVGALSHFSWCRINTFTNVHLEKIKIMCGMCVYLYMYEGACLCVGCVTEWEREWYQMRTKNKCVCV